jgi:VWFA-related protein
LESHASSPQSEDSTYHSSPSEVRLVFFASDERNRRIENLQRGDFAVVDNGSVIRNFRSFSRSGSVKLDLIILLDCSESVLPVFRAELANALALISQPWPQADNVSILSFSGVNVASLCAGDCRTRFNAELADSLSSGGSTPLFDAVMEATQVLAERRQPDVAPVIILFSDGDDTISRASFAELLRAISASEEQIYAVDMESNSKGKAILQTLADASGGVRLPFSDAPLKILNQVMDDLHSGLLVTYPLPQSQADFHWVRILPTHNLKLQFRCRRGYFENRFASAAQE